MSGLCHQSLDFQIEPMRNLEKTVWVSALALATATLLAFDAQSPPQPARFTESIKGTALSIDLIPVATAEGGPPIWMSRTEISWDLLDVCVFGFDKKQGKSESPTADAVTRPTKPYVAADRGFGHAGWPANSVSIQNARAFCRWISAKTGKKYRLPTHAEWKLACESSKIDPKNLDEFAWFDANSDGTTHKIGSKKEDAQGLHDLFGNLAEWCTLVDGTGAVVGGSYRDAQSEVGCAALLHDTPKWNVSDPQIPRSSWWLADAGWIGFRIVCEGPTAPTSAQPVTPVSPVSPVPSTPQGESK